MPRQAPSPSTVINRTRGSMPGGGDIFPYKMGDIIRQKASGGKKRSAYLVRDSEDDDEQDGRAEEFIEKTRH
jgi:hypothetical protein